MPAMKTEPQIRILSTLQRAFIQQLVLIGLVTVIGVLAAFFIAERILVNKALQGEADYYWNKRVDHRDIPLPDTLNLSAYSSFDALNVPPEEYLAFEPGQHRIGHDDQSRIVHISEVDGERLYLLFEESTVSDLAFYFGVLPLLLVLLIMYGFAYMTYYATKQAISPLSQLAGAIEQFNFGGQDANKLDLNYLSNSSSSETRILADAIQHFVNRSHASIERERNFTRYASHELRTPLAVIQGSVSSLEILELDGAPGRAVERIKRTCKSMGDLLGTLLLLAREQREPEEHASTDVSELLTTMVRQVNDVRTDQTVDICLNLNAELSLNAPESVVSIVLGNLLNNARSYTHTGVITIDVNADSVSISDSGVGMSDTVLARLYEPFFRAEEGDSEHQGLGMAIVQQTCERYKWHLTVESTVNIGTQVTVEFKEP